MAPGPPEIAKGSVASFVESQAADTLSQLKELLVGAHSCALLDFPNHNNVGDNAIDTHFGDSDPAYERHATDYESPDCSPGEGTRHSRVMDLGRSVLRPARSASRHWRGEVYNKAFMRADEPLMVRAGLPHLARWLDSHDVDLTVVSDSEWFDSSVRRRSPSELHRIVR